MDKKEMEASAPAMLNQPAATASPPYPQPNPGNPYTQNWSEPQAVPAVAMQPTTTVFVAQPANQNVHVPDEMCFSILTTIFCCLYLGVPAMCLASQANSLKHTDPQAALCRAKAARALNITAVVLGSIVIIAILVIRFTCPSCYYYSYSYSYSG